MGAQSASAVKGPASAAKQATPDNAHASERASNQPQRRRDTGAATSPSSFSMIPAIAPGEGAAPSRWSLRTPTQTTPAARLSTTQPARALRDVQDRYVHPGFGRDGVQRDGFARDRGERRSAERVLPERGLHESDVDERAGTEPSEFLFLQRKCSTCAADDEDVEIRRKPIASAAPLPVAPPEPAPPALFLQRKCATCAAEEEEAPVVQRKPVAVDAPVEALLVQRKCSSCEAEDDLDVHRKSAAPSLRLDESTPAHFSRPERLVRETLAHSYGETLAPAVRREMERAYGVDLGNVRIHVDALAANASDAVAAQAFTLGQSIYFGAGRYQPQTPGGRELLAHELAHVVQNRIGGAPSPSRKRRLQVSGPHDPAEVEADAAARAVLAGQTFRIRAHGVGAVQRKGAIDTVVDWGKTTVDKAESTLESGAKKVVQFTGDQLMRLVRSVAPGLAGIIDEGPVNFAKRKVSEALDAHMPAALGGFSISELTKGVTSWLGEAKDFVKNLLKGEAGACEKFKGFMHKLTDFVGKLIDNPVVEAVTGALGKATDFVTKILKIVGEPLFDGLKQYVAGTWSALKKVANTISGWFDQAKAALGDAWTQLMSLLGFDGSSEDGVWSWIKNQAAKVWGAIKDAVAPVIEPLKKIASVVALLTPMGQIHAIVKYGPKLVKVAKWIWENGLSPEKIREAPEEIRGMLESIGGNVDGFKSTLQGGLDWLSDNLSKLAEAVLSAASTISGLPLIGFAHDLFDKARSALTDIVADIKKGAEEALASIESAAERIGKFVEPYKEVISSLIVAIAAPPMIPLILAGWAWQKLPRCVKLPILDFVLDIAIKAITTIPAIPTFGVLWPLLKPGVLAFLQTLRGAEDNVKEVVSNKIARVISGASPEFLIGFVKGFAQGVWEGITDPISAIWTVMEGLDTATQYLLSLAGLGDDDETVAHAQPAGGEAVVAGAKPAAMKGAEAAPASTKGAGTAPEGFATLSKAPASAKPGAPAPGGTATLTKAHAAPAAASPAAGGSATLAKAQPSAAAPAAGAPAKTPVAAPAPTSAKGVEASSAQTAAASSKGAAAAPEKGAAATAKPAASAPAKSAAAHGEFTASRAPAPTPDADAGGTEVDAKSMSPEDLAALKSAAGEAAAAIGPDVDTVKGNFWGAVQEYFNGSSITFDEMVARLSETWEAAKTKIAEGGSWLANQLMGFFKGDGAEGELGDKVGWLTGSIVFQVVLDAITAGTWTEADSILVGIAKFINWPMEALGEAFKLLKKLGKYLLEGLKSLGAAIKEAASGAFKLVSKAIGSIGEKLMAFGERIFGKVGGKAAKLESKALGALGKEGVELGGREATNIAAKDSAKALEEKALADEAKVAKEHEPSTKQEAQAGEPAEPNLAEAKTPAETGHIDSDKLTPAQLHGETEMLAEHPGMVEGTPPHRRAEVGEHEWTENPLADGECEFCRHSNKRVCIKTPELRAKELDKAEKRAEEARDLAQKHADEAAHARLEADTHPGLSQSDRAGWTNEFDEASKRGEAAKSRLSAAEDELAKAKKAGDAKRLEEAENKINQLKAEVGKAEADAQEARRILDEQSNAIAKADAAEAKSAASKSDLAATEGAAAEQRKLTQTIEDKEKEIQKLWKENKYVRPSSSSAAGQKLEQAERELAKAQEKLETHIANAQGMTPEIRDTLRRSTPFGGEGGAERYSEWLNNLPPSAKSGGNYVDYVTGEALPLSKLSPDHIVPVDEIFSMEGFGKLSPKDKLEVLDLEGNLAFLERSRNSSKQAQSLADWLASDKKLAPKLTPDKVRELKDLEDKARKSVQDEIRKRLEAAAR